MDSPKNCKRGVSMCKPMKTTHLPVENISIRRFGNVLICFVFMLYDI